MLLGAGQGGGGVYGCIKQAEPLHTEHTHTSVWPALTLRRWSDVLIIDPDEWSISDVFVQVLPFADCVCRCNTRCWLWHTTSTNSIVNSLEPLERPGVMIWLLPSHNVSCDLGSRNCVDTLVGP